MNALLRPLLAVVLSSLLAVFGLAPIRAMPAAGAGPSSVAAWPSNTANAAGGAHWRKTAQQIGAWRTRLALGRKGGLAPSGLEGGADDHDLLAASARFGRPLAPGPLPARLLERESERVHAAYQGRAPPVLS